MGKICRGISDVCRISGHTSSIPTKYQTVVISNEEKKGFSSQAKRFSPLDALNENPGPGSYCSASSAETFSPSFSKKGTTSFPSKAPRVPPQRPQRAAPGPDAYNLQSSPILQHRFGRGPSRAFRAPVAGPVQEPKYQTPGPDQYDVRGGPGGPADRTFWTKGSSAFLSRTRRCIFALHPELPSPCHYHVSSAAMRDNPRASLSPFRSKSSRLPVPVDRGRPRARDLRPLPDPRPGEETRPAAEETSPGDGHAPLAVPGGPPAPGPGQYDIVDYKGPPRLPVSTAAFVSGTRRSPQGSRRGQDGPGPGYYEPQKISKQSFLYNPNIWNPT